MNSAVFNQTQCCGCIFLPAINVDGSHPIVKIKAGECTNRDEKEQIPAGGNAVGATAADRHQKMLPVSMQR